MPIEMPRGLPFSVDTWTPSSMRKRHHFLTHSHKDHCSGIARHASYPIYSTHLTKSLILIYYPQLDESMFVGIEVGQSVTIDDPDGAFSVTAFDANHCPGAVMFLFEGSFGNILHTGDCRLTPECLQKLPEKYLSRKGKEPECRLTYLFLDCTFGKITFRIPSKHSAIQQVVNCIWRHPDAPVVYLSCDLLGQEEILVSVSQTFGSTIYVDKVNNPEFYRVLTLTASEILSQDPSSRFQLFNGFPKLYERAQKKLAEARAKLQHEPLILRPSAQWYACEATELMATERQRIERPNKVVKDKFGIWHVCYSMHSSKHELEWALELLSPKWVVSTTPSCQAMELDYVKQHCFGAKVAFHDPFWKLLDISVEASSTPEEAELSELCSELPLLKIPTSDMDFSNVSPPTNEPPFTLFGRARLGFDFCNLYVEKKIAAVTDEPVRVVTWEDDKEVESNKLEGGVAEVQPNILMERKGVCKSVSDFMTRSSKGYNDSLRKLYGSMNVPVPQPLPSLVELMKANKRAKMQFES
ncbi:hypothetical protein Nepgr_026948 [Nepenthes gracilis]|uniref:DNA repair metallo-beta-lactamase domain-containing protein n=1 Tax=Nepenthes gracilis TaxID=150966 RepID=A0AAD3T900_NEPGR|nr:hypothetical protein Nepgr_026948 [Nepenthes gracilis]